MKRVPRWVDFTIDPVDPASIQELVEQVAMHYRTLYHKCGRDRHTSWRSSAQSTLSLIKSHALARGCDQETARHIRLDDDDITTLNQERSDRLAKTASKLPVVCVNSIVNTARALLGKNTDAAVRLVALCLATGRRWGELLTTCTISPAVVSHNTLPEYWCDMHGLAKQRLEDRTITAPVLMPAKKIPGLLSAIRDDLPCETLHEANSKYARIVSAVVKHIFPGIGKAHNMRKVYVIVCHKYFNVGSDSMPLLASRVLGHKSMSGAVLTYIAGFIDEQTTTIKW